LATLIKIITIRADEQDCIKGDTCSMAFGHTLQMRFKNQLAAKQTMKDASRYPLVANL